ncbi:MAG: T9SS type A sorting domain-containing protein, partial [Bacteroidales bacterium]|nr:T9SS type A sorting domain-containing protein [Bacteroidales bacterium]
LGTCPVIGTATYQGVLLGDVNGNYKNIAADGLIKSGLLKSADQVVIDIQNAVMVNGYLEVPVMVSSLQDIKALDLALILPQGLKFEGVTGLVSGMQAQGHYNTADATLRLTSYSQVTYPVNQPVMVIRFAAQNPSLSMTGVAAYTNGEASNLLVGSPTGLGEFSKESISIYPNPASDKLYVVVPVDATVQLRDITGRIVIAPVEAFAAEALELNTSELVDGVYFLNVLNDNQMTTHRIVVKK